MRSTSLRLTLSLVSLYALCSPKLASAAVDFAHEVVPILRQHCAECHTGDAKKGGFSLNDRLALISGSENGSMLTAGKSDESYLIELVTSNDSDLQMPPKGPRLSAREVATLRQWIDEGLLWEEGFAFKKPPYEPPLRPNKPELPPAVGGRNHPIDRIIDQYLAERQIARPARMNDLSFLRRTSLDLVGLIPDPEGVQAFLNDPTSEKRARWIDNLLADDLGYADHWLTFWNDLLRNDYSGTGFITGGRKQISNWLYRSLVANKPFDQFVRELIAPPSDESRGFIDGIKWRGDVSAGQTVEIQFAQSVSQSFLGINMKCASCHDSFIDRWKLSEAYGLAAVYASKPMDISRCDMPTGEQAKAAWLFPELGEIDPESPQPARLEQLAKLMTSSENGRFARTIVNRLWHRMMGRGIVHPVDAMQTEPWSVDLLDHLATKLVDSGYDLRKLLAHIANSEAYQSQSQIVDHATDGDGFQYAGPRAKRMTAEQFVDAIWTLTGSAPKRFDAPILRGRFDKEVLDKLQLTGKWIWSDLIATTGPREKTKSLLFRKSFPLSDTIVLAGAMITVDRAFTLFVNNREVSKDDDWKLVEMIPIHQQLKKGNNSIAILANGPNTDASAGGLYFEAKIQLENGQLITIASDDSWQVTTSLPAMNEKRLSAIDNAEFKPVKVVDPRPEWAEAIQTQGPTLLSQAVSTEVRMIRASLVKSDFLMRALGRPNRDQIVSMRPDELTTLEAIDLANGQTLAELLAAGAKRLAKMEWGDNDQLVIHLYRHALTRDPSPGELAIAKASLGTKPNETVIEDLLWVLCMTPEFQYVR